MFFYKPEIAGLSVLSVLHMDYCQILPVFLSFSVKYSDLHKNSKKHLLSSDPLGNKGDKTRKFTTFWCFLGFLGVHKTGKSTNPMCRTEKKPGELVTQRPCGYWVPDSGTAWVGTRGSGTRGNGVVVTVRTSVPPRVHPPGILLRVLVALQWGLQWGLTVGILANTGKHGQTRANTGKHEKTRKIMKFSEKIMKFSENHQKIMKFSEKS